jgi:GABA(A) receptor-associated protein
MNFDNLTLEERQNESKNILSKYPERIPVIVSKSKNSKLNDIDKKKFLVPCDLTIGQFMYVIRKKIKMCPSEAIFLYVNNTLPPTMSSIKNIYEAHKNADGFLYIEYNGEETFG